ncbi:protein-tyrosine phosphatase family protein [Acidocella aminolytica]|uniref:DUF883 domain-containing protein n=1 Tax=Acidocella aminolytica 101 = DSM 11237 TaxID=1120923 RepID=A0A0D6PE94_9PROT|nr:hypothetical protein [Acidocella aminolytica]GAN79997.1 hypothetical protein Aam_035_004 [Acidocella aminolytica 101 = DSM 11237]GBQ40403.1 hypothetical protein AA11237_2350 [Acidocella aminolytica 101 = DSM 11237]SHF09019.1 hypothetical protein SAMN02746095_02090 [Acidocella aminolytica 101 = DSM 11237]
MCAKRIDPSSIDIDHLRQEFEKFRAGLGDAADKLGDNAHTALDQITEYLNGGSLSSRVASLEEELEILGARLKGSSKDAVAKLETEASARPLAAMALAFGAGLLAASLLRRG